MADIMDEDPSSGMQSSEEDQEVPVESLVRGRAKRSTAGRHMSALLEAAADDDLALLFEEVEDDNEFADLVDPDAEEDVGLDSSDDDDDQGPNAQNDYEGEQQLQKDERKKRKTQNDLRFQTLRKRVKIDPTAVSSMAPAPRPKKKSERISWIPTTEDGPTRQSSRRQTMVNKELTHARLKDSQEKRVRIIATMKEAEKRKAHLKPKAMTQEDHLAEAARIERLNSKSLNRWELSEKRKADERRARIEALQNRRLDGPVISYWSGVATWTNGRLTRVGTVDIKPKPDKEEARKKKKEKEDKEKAAAELQALQSAPAGLPPVAGPSSAAITTTPQVPGTNPAEAAMAPAVSIPPNPTSSSSEIAHEQPTLFENPTAQGQGVDGTSGAPLSSETLSSEGAKANQPDVQLPETTDPVITPGLDQDNQGKESHADETPAPATSADPLEQDKTAEKLTTEPAAETATVTKKHPSFAVEIPVFRNPSLSGNDSQKPPESSNRNTDDMDIDNPAVDEAPAAAAKGPSVEESTDKSKPATPPVDSAQSIGTETSQANIELVAPSTSQGEIPPVESITPIGPAVALAPHSAPAVAPQATLPESALTPSLNQPSTPSSELQLPNVKVEPVEATVPPPPAVIEHTGRTLTVLENFDYGTAQKSKYSMYFNAKKPPRLTKISSSLCVITSLPSRYRDPESGLPYANSYAYGQIRRLIADGYIWSAMLGCFVGPAEAARGVPERFSFARQQGPGTRILDHGLAESIDLPKAVPSTPTPAPHPPQAPGAMEVDSV